VVDRLGGGDSFCAGVLAGIVGGNPAGALAVAETYSALQQTHPGDFNYKYPSETSSSIPEP